MTIYLIRHGETEANAARVIQFEDDPLNQRGREQAERMAGRLANVGIAKLLVSDYLRTRMTAEPLQVATGAPQETTELLRERHFGDLRGLTSTEVGDLYRDDLAPAGGEDWPMFHHRVARAWQLVADRAAATDGHLAVVTHGMVCHSLALTQLTLASEMDIPRPFKNTSVTIVDSSPPWRVQRLNCYSHLEPDPT